MPAGAQCCRREITLPLALTAQRYIHPRCRQEIMLPVVHPLPCAGENHFFRSTTCMIIPPLPTGRHKNIVKTPGFLYI